MYKVIEWTKRYDNKGWWLVLVSGKDGSFTPVFGPSTKKRATEMFEALKADVEDASPEELEAAEGILERARRDA